MTDRSSPPTTRHRPPTTDHRSLAAGGALLALALAGCATPGNPYTRGDLPIRRVAIAPFFVLPATYHDTSAVLGGRRYSDGGTEAWVSAPVADEFRHELTRFTGWQSILGPDDVEAARGADAALSLHRPEDLKALGRLLAVDAVAVGAVTQFTNLSGQPRLGFWFQLYYVPTMERQSETWFLETARGLAAPPGFEAFTNQAPVYAQFVTYDAALEDTADLVRGYAREVEQGDRFLTIEEQILKEPYPRFFRVAFWDTIHRMIRQEERRQREVDYEQP